MPLRTRPAHETCVRAGMTGAYSFRRPCRLGLACAAAFMPFVGNGAGEGGGRGWRMSAAPYAAAAEARSCASWPRKSMNLPSSAAAAAFALQGATPLSSRLLLLVQGLSDVNCNLEAASHGMAITQSGGCAFAIQVTFRHVPAYDGFPEGPRPRHQRRHERCRVPHKLVLPP